MAGMGNTADDVVERLRSTVCWCHEFEGICDACIAADEIERLRQVNANALATTPHVKGAQNAMTDETDRLRALSETALEGWIALEAAVGDFLMVLQGEGESAEQDRTRALDDMKRLLGWKSHYHY
jgi:hypothetical protein